MYTKKLSTLTLICCLAIAPVFAQEEFNEEKFLKEIKKAKAENLNDDSIDKVKGLLFNKLFEEKNGIKTLKIANIEVEASRKLYGEDSLGLGYAYTDLIDTSIYTQSPLKVLELIKKAEAISQKHPTDKSLHINTQRNYETLYSHFEQPSKALKYVIARSDEAEKEEHQLRYIKAQENAKQTLKLLKDLEKEAIKTNNESLLSKVYSYYITVYSDTDNYNEMFKVIEKAEKYTPNDKGLEGAIVNAKNTYEKETSQFDKARELIEEYYKDKTYIEKLEYHNMLCDIEKDSKNLEKAIEHIEQMNDFYSDSFPKDSKMFAHYIYEKFIDVYKDMEEFKKVKKYVDEYKELTEASKEITPIYYAKYLDKLSSYEQAINDHKAALNERKRAAILYETYEPTAHKLAELYKDIAESNVNLGNTNAAIEYSKKALEHNLKYQGETEKDLKDVYSVLARTYAQIGNTEEEEKYLDKAISVYSNLLGKNNVKTLQEELEKVHFYNKIQQNEKAEAILNKVNKLVSENKHIGYSPDFLFKLVTINSWNSISKGDYEQALKDLELIKDVKFYRAHEKQQINEIKYHIYKNTDNKIKAYRYKKLADINE